MTTLSISAFSSKSSPRGRAVARGRLSTRVALRWVAARVALVILKTSRFVYMPLIVLVCGWILGAWVFWNIQRERRALDAWHLKNHIERAEDEIQQRMKTYTDALYGAAGLFAASSEVSRQEWHRFTQTIDLTRRYPDILGMSVVLPVQERELGRFEEGMRSEVSSFRVHGVPGGDSAPLDPAGAKHFVVSFFEPGGVSSSALGLDIATDNRHFVAARFSRDYDQPRLSQRVFLNMDGVESPGFVLYVPMYAPGKPHNSVQSRRENFRGWISAPFLTTQFFKECLTELGDTVQLRIYEGLKPRSGDLLFNSGDDVEGSAEGKSVIQMAGEQFTCEWNRGPNFEHSTGNTIFEAALLAVVPMLLAGLVMSLQNVSRKAMTLVDLRTEQLLRAQAEAQSAREVAESANLAKSEFLATMSHEIRTPMNAIVGYTDLLAEADLPEEQLGWARTIQASGHILLSLINDILDFSKIEAGRLTLESIPFSPGRSAGEVIEVLKFQASQKKLDLRLEVNQPGPGFVLGDPVRFRQILINLVSNAIKFTSAGSVSVTVGVGSGGVNVAVEDTGIGIPEEQQGKLFQRFSQVDSSTTRRFGGTGLGLAICRRLVELMGGEIGVKSTEGAGTTFWFKVPLFAAKGEDHDTGASCSEQVDQPGRGRRILVADDVPANQKLVQIMLTRLGCTVQTASSGKEAVALAETGNFEIIFMDCQMPDLDGYEATREIRRGSAKDVIIIALTASALDGDGVRCLESGMDGYLRKPFKRSELIQVLRGVIPRR